MQNHTITFAPQLSDGEFDELCRRFDDMNLELTKEGTIRLTMLPGNDHSAANAEILGQLGRWWHTHRQGRIFAHTLFTLPDGSKLGPDDAYITAERLAVIPREALRGFAPVCPNFVIELLSASDSLEEASSKMQDWIANGVELGWLIDPYQQRTHVFVPDHSFRTFACELNGSGAVRGFTLDLAEVWRTYE